eukprot:TRINITY_DN4407_c0_g1_i32.p1 TRINITY_DN4407_c0_g1~~TRINITY_DN4407_c0_g1_i32.p1  ORF type:complete len:571 (-),score=146.77 TRINITY_DN4407_c0_g1_i32:253-1965(-)
MCIRDRYQRRVHGDDISNNNQINKKTQILSRKGGSCVRRRKPTQLTSTQLMGGLLCKCRKRSEGLEAMTTPRTPFLTKAKEINSAQDFKITSKDLVQQKNSKILEDYNLLQPPLGKGAYAEVRKAVHKITGVYRAVKVVDKEGMDEGRLKLEVEILKHLDHPHILKVFEFYETEKHFYIVTDLLTGGELFDKITELKSFTEAKAAETMRQILSAIAYCHKNKIVHRDLKPENIIYESQTSNILKIVDWGTSRVYESGRMATRFGTPYYIAPEVLKKNYTEKCDVWSCGIIMYILLCGEPPFNGNSDEEIMKKVEKGVWVFKGDVWNSISEGAKDLIKKMLEVDVKKRCTAEQAYNDPWIQNQSRKEDIDTPIAASILTNLRQFTAGQKLQQAMWVFLTSFLSSKEEKRELMQLFNQLDLNGDGVISKEELILGYRKIMNFAGAEEEVEKIMKMVDSNQSGSIDYSEFVTATINRQNMLSEERLRMAFKIFDKDNSESISIDELKLIFNNTGITDKAWEEILGEVNLANPKEITFPEFKSMMLKLLAQVLASDVRALYSLALRNLIRIYKG